MIVYGVLAVSKVFSPRAFVLYLAMLYCFAACDSRNRHRTCHMPGTIPTGREM